MVWVTSCACPAGCGSAAVGRRQGPICKMQKQLFPFSVTARGSRVGARTDGCLSPASAAKAERDT